MYNTVIDKRIWNFRDIIYIILIYLLFQFLMVLLSFYIKLGVDMRQSMSYIFLIILIFFWQKTIKKISLRHLGFLACSPPIKIYSIALILAFFYFILTIIFFPKKMNIILVHHFAPTYFKMIFIFFTTTLKGISAAFLIPFGEELFFRSSFYPVLRDRFGSIRGILCISLLFAFSHYFFNIGASGIYKLISSSFIASVVLTWLFEYSKSIYPVFISHSLINIMVISTDAIIKIQK